MKISVQAQRRIDSRRKRESRPNKLAKGFTKNESRRKRKEWVNLSRDNPIYKKGYIVNCLIVLGTCDKLGRNMWLFKTTKGGAICPCCNQASKKYRLNDKGRAKLARMKRNK